MNNIEFHNNYKTCYIFFGGGDYYLHFFRRRGVQVHDTEKLRYSPLCFYM